MIQSLPRSGRPKLPCTRDTLSVLGHANAVIAVYILLQRITKYILYRFKVTGSLHFACNSMYSPSHPLSTVLQSLCEIISGDVLLRTRCWLDTNVM